MNNELETLQAEVRRLSRENANRQRQMDLLYETVKDLSAAFQKLNAGLTALQTAVELMTGTGRN